MPQNGACAKPKRARAKDSQDSQPASQSQRKDFLRSDLQGEFRDNQVVCLGCSTEANTVWKTTFHWNRHVKGVHEKEESMCKPVEKPAEQKTASAVSEKSRQISAKRHVKPSKNSDLNRSQAGQDVSTAVPSASISPNTIESPGTSSQNVLFSSDFRGKQNAFSMNNVAGV